jgi:general secretion pathway protein A
MDYFKILNLKTEPFSNSPEPGFFYQSDKHLGCLQKLELAVRLRRGLNVVIGDVGTGKTTLCRQLILKFSETEEDKRQIETHLLMDPAFTTSSEFLSTVAMTFGLKESEKTEWQIKENIKKYLFVKGVEEGKTVVLIIDEGQKLPDFCLEILREFLNYETNEFKLLQIVIFAQTEFGETLKQKANFSDRINLFYILKPLSFVETRDMVRFRIEKASEGSRPPNLFTFPGLLALYLATGGYPRKIVTLCHQVMLSLIIQNRSKAGWLLVRSCDRRVSPVQRRYIKWVAVSGLFLFVIAGIGAGLYPDLMRIAAPEKETVISKIIPTEQSAPVVKQSDKAPVSEAIAKVSHAKPSPPKTMPEFFGKLTLKSGRTIWRMLNDFYGDFDNGQFKAVVKANPHIKNLNRVHAGEVIWLPVMSSSANPLASAKYWVQIAVNQKLEEIYEEYRKYDSFSPPMRFLPYFNSREGLVFAVFLKSGFDSQEAAANMIRQLPQTLAAPAKIVNGLAADTVYFQK